MVNYIVLRVSLLIATPVACCSVFLDTGLFIASVSIIFIVVVCFVFTCTIVTANWLSLSLESRVSSTVEFNLAMSGGRMHALASHRLSQRCKQMGSGGRGAKKIRVPFNTGTIIITSVWWPFVYALISAVLCWPLYLCICIYAEFKYSDENLIISNRLSHCLPEDYEIKAQLNCMPANFPRARYKSLIPCPRLYQTTPAPRGVSIISTEAALTQYTLLSGQRQR